MFLSTLCYLEKDGKYLLLHRSKDTPNDVNDGKWIGVGGKFLPGESPEECVCREVLEETGLVLDDYTLRGILTFSSQGWEDECIFVYTASAFHGHEIECTEGELQWISFDKLFSLNLWEGDRIFLKLLMEGSPLFSLKLSYEQDRLVESTLKEYKTDKRGSRW